MRNAVHRHAATLTCLLILVAPGCSAEQRHEIELHDIRAHRANIGQGIAESIHLETMRIVLEGPGTALPSRPALDSCLRTLVRLSCDGFLVDRFVGEDRSFELEEQSRRELQERIHADLVRALGPERSRDGVVHVGHCGLTLSAPLSVYEVEIPTAVYAADYSHHTQSVVLTVLGEQRVFRYDVFVRRPGELSVAQTEELRRRVAAVDLSDVTWQRSDRFDEIPDRIKAVCEAYLAELDLEGIATQTVSHTVGSLPE